MFRGEAIRGHISKSFQLIVMAYETPERASDPKVCEACLAVPSDQNVTLDVPSVNAELIYSFVLLTGVMPPCKISSR